MTQQLLFVSWDDREQIGVLEQVDGQPESYSFRYTGASRPISLSLKLGEEPFSPAASRPFFEALLPEGTIRDQVARQLKVASSDSFALLEQLGHDCAGALQIFETPPPHSPPAVEWLSEPDLDELIEQLPRYPLGIGPGSKRMRLSLAGVQNKATLVRDREGRFGRPLDGMPSTHILKPELPGVTYPDLATNEYFCMRLAARSSLAAAEVELTEIAGRSCLVVTRFDRDTSVWPPRRLHQEDLCQALGISPTFKYQEPGRAVPSYRALAELLDRHAAQPGLDRLEGARATVFHFLVGNADAHAKNVSLMHLDDGVRLAPLYDVVSTVAYPELDDRLALGIGDEFDPHAISTIHWSDLAEDFGLNPRAFGSLRQAMCEQTLAEAKQLRAEALEAGWHRGCIDAIVQTIESRTARVMP
ncbi:MAG TPA: HipA domain-containing protein [Solirubrobacteraceae bacterium]|jgi:serine/threonine-protein kinase HipA